MSGVCVKFFTVALIVSLWCWHCARPIDRTENQPGVTTVVGTLNVAGNEPFSELRLYLATGVSYTLVGDSAVLRTLWKHQGKSVRCNGTLQSHGGIKRFHIISYELNGER